jgi:hypothetical protein
VNVSPSCDTNNGGDGSRDLTDNLQQLQPVSDELRPTVPDLRPTL